VNGGEREHLSLQEGQLKLKGAILEERLQYNSRDPKELLYIKRKYGEGGTFIVPSLEEVPEDCGTGLGSFLFMRGKIPYRGMDYLAKKTQRKELNKKRLSVVEKRKENR